MSGDKSKSYLFEVKIPMEPQAREEPIFSRKYNKMFTPKRTKNAQARIRFFLSRAFLPTDKTILGPVGVEVTFWLRRPASRPFAKFNYPDVRPDLDNYTKTVGDCLNVLVIKDDGQICDYQLKKRYADECDPGIDIKVWCLDF